MHLGVFDSGIGGEAIASALRVSFPEAVVTVVNDKENLPYGDKSSKEVQKLTEVAIQPLLHMECDVIIIACNTATALAIDSLRKSHPTQKFIGIEPMIKTASEVTRSSVIAVCATPATLKSVRYRDLITKYCQSVRVIEPDCRTWAGMIEDNTLEHHLVEHTVDSCLGSNADVIVLGCTHYHWIKQLIVTRAGKNVTVLEPSEAIARRVQTLLSSTEPSRRK
jgi:glutamate racemase